MKLKFWLKDESELNNIITAYGNNIFLPNSFISQDISVFQQLKYFTRYRSQ